MTTTEAKVFFTRPARLEEKKRRLKDNLERLRAEKLGLRSVDYSATRAATGRHDAQEMRIIKFVEQTAELRIEIMETDFDALQANFDISAAMEDVGGDLSDETYYYLHSKYDCGAKLQKTNTTEEEALAEFAEVVTKRQKEGDTFKWFTP